MEEPTGIEAEPPLQLLALGQPAPGAGWEALESAGLVIQAVGDPDAAVAGAESGEFHALLVDLALVRGGDIRGAARLEEVAAVLPVIALVDFDDDANEAEATRLGAREILVRSRLDARGLHRSVRRTADHQRALQELARSTEREHYLSTHDSLTGLMNRFEFRDQLRRAMAFAKRKRQPFALLFVDLDRFKDVNDIRGQRLGDELLKGVAERLVASARKSDLVARVGGDEFMLMLPDVTRSHGPAVVGESLLEVLAEPFQVSGQEYWISASIGIAVYPRDGKDPERLIANAEAAMVAAKAEGTGRYHYYAEYLNGVAVERLAEEKRLRLAIEREEFVLHFQPQIDVAAGRIEGAEALVRWQDPERGLVPPNEFIPIAEETGMIIALGEWVLRSACQNAVRWSQPVRVGVNVSARQLARKGFVDTVAAALQESRLDASRLEVEITESSILETGGRTIATLRGLRKLGVRVSIDDFGTGYSSLVALKTLPVDGIKIDRAFIRNILTDPADATITKALITMGRGLERTLVAEGVETLEQLEYLYRHGCHLIQGYLLGKPVAGEEFEAQLGSEQAPWMEPLASLRD